MPSWVVSGEAPATSPSAQRESNQCQLSVVATFASLVVLLPKQLSAESQRGLWALFIYLETGKRRKNGVHSGTGRVHTRTLRMFVTVGSARRISPGLGWMLAFSDDFSWGSRSAVLWS